MLLRIVTYATETLPTKTVIKLVSDSASDRLSVATENDANNRLGYSKLAGHL